MVPSVAPPHMAGVLAQSSSNSGIFFQGDGQSQTNINSHLSSSFGNSSNSFHGNGQVHPGTSFGVIDNAILNTVTSSGPSAGSSSLVTDANSSLTGGPHVQRTASSNTESYMRLPASPISFSSHNMSISGSSAVEGSCIAHLGNTESMSQSMPANNHNQGGSSATSLPTSDTTNAGHHMGPRVMASFTQDLNNGLPHMPKKARLDFKNEELLQHQIFQQYLQRQESVQMQNRNPQLQNLLQHRLRQQQQILQSMPPLQRAQFQQHQLLQQMQQQALRPASGVKRTYDGGVCARRLMQYLYHQRQRQQENTITYWRKFVAEYYSPHAKKRWCLSLYDNVGQHAVGVFPQAVMEAWQCDICGSKYGRGFEASFEILPRLNEIKFGSGIIDELLYLDLPRESRFPSGMMMLEYGKAIQESVYEQVRVVREGQLRVIFTQDLKILSWEFCARRHEELLPRRILYPQVHQLVQFANKCQSTISEGGADGVSPQELQTISNKVLCAGRQLARSLDSNSLNDLGFPKRYVRCLQISEVVNSMKDLIDFCKDHKVGPIEGLKNYPRQISRTKLHIQQKMNGMEQMANGQGINPNKFMLRPGMNISVSSRQIPGGQPSDQPAMSLANYQNLIMRQNPNSIPSHLQSNASISLNNANQPIPPHIMGHTSLVPAAMRSLPAASISAPIPAQSLPQQNLAKNTAHGSNPHAAQDNPMLEQQIQQLLQMSSANGAMQNGGGGTLPRNGMCFQGNNRHVNLANNASKSPYSTVSSASAGNSNFYNQRSEVTSHSPDDDAVSDIARELTENGYFNSDLYDNLGYGWKG